MWEQWSSRRWFLEYGTDNDSILLSERSFGAGAVSFLIIPVLFVIQDNIDQSSENVLEILHVEQKNHLKSNHISNIIVQK